MGIYNSWCNNRLRFLYSVNRAKFKKKNKNSVVELLKGNVRFFSTGILSEMRFESGITHRVEIPKAARQHGHVKWRSTGNAVGQYEKRRRWDNE